MWQGGDVDEGREASRFRIEHDRGAGGTSQGQHPLTWEERVGARTCGVFLSKIGIRGNEAGGGY